MARLDQLLQLLESSPKDSFLLFALAKEYEGLGNDDKALEYYLSLRESNPGYVGLYYHLGKLYLRKQDIDQAVSVYKAGMEVANLAGDRHAYNELSGAKMEISEEDFEE
ncbi:MAG: tetratricopeptide repeat protein [Saprospirales bacterium]|jgi:tetratricopeptide (TPR) repeat protein|nr:tetratricopeptide repeat protein [Saprospirales bacterium]MBK6905172.1 tetratricopeptide repeat protein [Saprospirales bacterium]MBK7335164.1 tetratricopeptide repeat protein [Saprospirales bacterium]